MRLKISSGDKRYFGDDITNLGPLIPISDENEELVGNKAKKSKFFAHEKFQVVKAMKNLRQFLNKI